MKENLTAKLYSDILLEEWSSKENIWREEAYFINKYLTDNSLKVLEAGTGGGRISNYIESLGFKNIEAFDISPEMIEIAQLNALKTGSKINFSCHDASDLTSFEDKSFSYLIYLQQVLSMISDPLFFYKAIEESHRISKNGGIVIFSFLDYDGRFYNPLLSFILKIVRVFRREKIPFNVLPWLHYVGKINWKLFNKNQPLLTWILKDRLISDFEKIGFKVLEVKNDSQVFKQTSKRVGGIYIICQKK